MKRKRLPAEGVNKIQPKQVGYIISDTLLDTDLKRIPRSIITVKPSKRQNGKDLEAH